MSSSQRALPIARRHLECHRQNNLEILATHKAQRIRDAERTEKEPRVLVIDFFPGSPGVSSSSGTLLADRFSESLANSSRKIEMIDRKNFTYMGHELGATGIVLGCVYEQNVAIGLKIHPSGFGLSDESNSEFGDLDEVAWLSAIEQTKDLLLERGPNDARKPEQMPEAPGALQAGLEGVAMPTCVHCPDWPYADPARVAKVQGTVVLGSPAKASRAQSRYYRPLPLA